MSCQLSQKSPPLINENHLDSDSKYEVSAQSGNRKPVSPAEVRPLPKRKDLHQRRKKSHTTEIITSSLFKDKLLARAQMVRGNGE